jgi:N-6 DNA Methylase
MRAPMTNGASGDLGTALDVLGYADSEGLLTAADTLTSTPDSEVSSRAYLWRDLHLRVGLDAAFFHDGVPLVGFSDCTASDGLGDLRKRLWNYGRVPLLIVSTEQGIEAFNGLNLPNEAASDQLADIDNRSQSRASEIVQAFSRRNIESGQFAQTFQASYRHPNRVDQSLLANLRLLRRNIAGNDPVSRSGLDVLVGASLTASYLADRNVLDADHLEELCGVASLDEALSQGPETTVRLFAGLAERFNGDVFGSVEEAIHGLDAAAVGAVASLLRGDDLATGQGALWPYDFAVLPPDLVSSVYEQLLEDQQHRDAAYYTPRSVVDLVLDEVVPWSDTRFPKLIDLACGSGAFLTEAFRRFAFKARLHATSPPTYASLRRLLTDHIFGIDINPAAARVAAFGAYLALLEEVDPPTIWKTVTLPKLIGRNIIVSDAFEDHELSDKKFDVVVSNPPWKRSLSTAASKFLRSRDLPVANSQMAHAFIWLATDVLKPGGQMGLVLPAKSVLHNRAEVAQDFRLRFFNSVDVRTVVDLSPIRRQLFAGAIAPPALIMATKPRSGRTPDSRADQQNIIHITVYPRSFSRIAGALVIAPEDLTVLSSAQARVRPDIWKPLVWGSLRDADFLDRMRAKHPSLRDIVEDRGWSVGQGYKEAPNQPQQDASFLAGMPIVDKDSVVPYGRPQFQRARFSRQTLHRPRTASQYRAPQVLVRRTLPNGRLAATLLREDAAYTSEMMSVSGPQADLVYLGLVATTISSAFGNYWQFMTSASWGVERDTVEENELLSMPVPLDSYELTRLVAALGEDAYATDAEAADDAIFDLLNLGRADRMRIRDTFANGLQRFSQGTAYEGTLDPATIRTYSETLQRVLVASLPEVEVEVGAELGDGYMSVWISFTDRAVLEDSRLADGRRNPADQRQGTRVDIDAILQSGAALSTGTIGMVSLPAAFLVDEDTVYLVKTTDRDRWSYNAALDDAERIFSVLAFGS